jgi:hypothetical protein
MRAPPFLNGGPAQEPAFLSRGEGGSGRFAARGCLLGSTLAIVLWFVPIPVAVMVWVLGLRGPFVDYMVLAIPFFVALPLIGAMIGAVYGHKRSLWRQQ